jgi:predicted anti-sigma-YlaC factor YlaD
MRCSVIREACSAKLDGEPTSLDQSIVNEHLRTCAGCRAFVEQSQRLVGASISARPVPALPELAPRVVSAAQEERTVRPFLASPVRIALVCVGAMQLALAIPSLLFGTDEGAPIHIAHEVGAWDLALAVGFIFAAWRPLRAVGMLPFAGALAAGLLLTAAIDIYNGRTPALSETTHLLELLGTALLYVLTAPRPRRTILRLIV